MKSSFIAFILLLSLNSFAQKTTFEVSVSKDTILLGNAFDIQYTYENISGDFQQPSFEGFEVVFGPQVSTSFQFINGESKQSASYLYRLRPIYIGCDSIPEAILLSDSETYKSPKVAYCVLENPDNIIDQDYQLKKRMPGILSEPIEEIKKPKRKIQKI